MCGMPFRTTSLDETFCDLEPDLSVAKFEYTNLFAIFRRDNGRVKGLESNIEFNSSV
jgi:hypothetical protein